MIASGGHYAEAANTVKSILYDIHDSVDFPFRKLKQTKNGENRIQNCVKYDLNGFSRLITIQYDNTIIIVYFDKHENCDKWLDNNKGKKITYDPTKKVIVDIFETENLDDADKLRKYESDYSNDLLYVKLGKYYFDKISTQVSGNLIIPFLEMTSTVDEDYLYESCCSIENSNIQSLFFDVFTSLVEGKIDLAKNRILSYFDELVALTDIDEETSNKIISNDIYIKSTDLDKDIIDFIVERSTWQEFMLFLHPYQKELVQKDYKGVARLLGVSGSGKTSILVHRAVRLAELYKGQKILIITLNSALSELLKDLIDELTALKNIEYLKENIIVTSFWDFCRDLLLKFNSDEPLINKKYSSEGYKDGTIKQIWDEYYYYEQEDFNGEAIFGIHQYLLNNNLNPKKYIREEYDWIRSAYDKNERSESYLINEREGRTVSFNTEFRQAILHGLEKWEDKMKFVGISDYMNLTTVLSDYINQISQDYRCVLVDEIQDFGTTELKIIKRLADDTHDNSFFFTGDLAQQVYAKHHKIRNAGFNILPGGFEQIIKNYRNSREILDAAYMMFQANVTDEQKVKDDLKVLDPEYANFSSPKPFIRKGNSLEHEISSALTYLRSFNEPNKKHCIAIANLGFFSIKKLGESLKISVLDGLSKIQVNNIFLSDLEQTKGFEFDRMIILNVSKNVFPNPHLPKDEIYRDICKLYVAMTRAKKELIISYSDSISNIFQSCSDYFRFDEWTNHTDVELNFKIDYSFENSNTINLNVQGKEFILSIDNLKISKNLQDKLIISVIGKSVTGVNDFKWKTMSDLFIDLSKNNLKIQIRNYFGPNNYSELIELQDKILNKK